MSGWYYQKTGMISDETIGPLSDAEFLEMVGSGKLSPDTKLVHPSHTSGKWVLAKQIPAFHQRLKQVEAERTQQQEQKKAAREAAKQAQHAEKEALRAEKRALREVRAHPAPVQVLPAELQQLSETTVRVITPQPVQVTVEQSSRAAHSLGIASLVLGIFSFCVCWMPLIAPFLSGTALLLGVTGIVIAVVRKGSGLGFSIAGVAVSAASVCVGLLFTYSIASTVASVAGPEREPRDVAQSRVLHKGFRVIEARLYVGEGGFMPQRRIVMDVGNETDHVISHARFHGIYATPGRTLPWYEGEFDYEIPGGLEPEETATWVISPNYLESWGVVEKREGAKLFVEVVQLDGADGEPLAARDPFTKQEQIEFMERLKKSAD